MNDDERADDITARVREALDGITPGEWESYSVPGDRTEAPYSAVEIGDHEVALRWLNGSAIDAAFIAAAPALVADLLAEVRRLEAERDQWQQRTFSAIATSLNEQRHSGAHAAIERVRALHQPEHGGRDSWFCQECGDHDPLWPCETVRALDGDA